MQPRKALNFHAAEKTFQCGPLASQPLFLQLKSPRRFSHFCRRTMNEFIKIVSHVFLEKLVIFCSRTFALKYFYFLIKSSKFAFSRFDWLSVTRIGKSLIRNYLRLEGFRLNFSVPTQCRTQSAIRNKGCP